jgi:membrane protein YdbS with pleckstrin-like domain
MTALHLVEKSEKDRQVVWQAYPSWAQFSWLYLLSALAALRGALFFRFGAGGWEMWLAGAGLLVAFAAFLRRWAHYELTKDELLIRNGYTGNEIQSLYVSDLRDVGVQQGPVAAFFGIGTLVVSSRSTDRLLSLRGVSDPEEVKIRIQGAAWRSNRAPVTSHHTPA